MSRKTAHGLQNGINGTRQLKLTSRTCHTKCLVLLSYACATYRCTVTCSAQCCRLRTAKGEVSNEATSKGAPGVKEAFQAFYVHPARTAHHSGVGSGTTTIWDLSALQSNFALSAVLTLRQPHVPQLQQLTRVQHRCACIQRQPGSQEVSTVLVCKVVACRNGTCMCKVYLRGVRNELHCVNMLLACRAVGMHEPRA